jgi:hypothetical protein
LIERPASLGILLVLHLPLLCDEFGPRLLHRRCVLRDHRNNQDLLSDRSDNNGELALASDFGGGGKFVGHPLGLGLEWSGCAADMRARGG